MLPAPGGSGGELGAVLGEGLFDSLVERRVFLTVGG
jgi:hypothetical protein